MSDDLIERECSCMEVHGENPACNLHGIETQWALENTLSADWQETAIQNQAVIKHQAATIRDLRVKLDALAKAEASYRHNHDLRGSVHITTGRAWDAMRRAGDEARTTLARIGDA